MEHDPNDNPSETMRFETQFSQLKKKLVKRFGHWVAYYLIFILVTVIGVYMTAIKNSIPYPYVGVFTEENIQFMVIICTVLSLLLVWFEDLQINIHVRTPFDRAETLIQNQLNEANDDDIDDIEIIPHTPRPEGYFQIPFLNPRDYNVKNGWIYWNWLWAFQYRMKRWLRQIFNAKYIRIMINCDSDSEEWNWYKDNENENEVLCFFFVYRYRLYHLNVNLFDEQYLDGILIPTFHIEYGKYVLVCDFDSVHGFKYRDLLTQLQNSNQLEYFSTNPIANENSENWEIDFRYECMTLSQLQSFLFYLGISNDPNDLIRWTK